MRIVVHGQQAFGKAVLEALIKRGENVVGVYVAPEKEGAKADPLKEAAIAAKLPVPPTTANVPESEFALTRPCTRRVPPGSLTRTRTRAVAPRPPPDKMVKVS